jgi:acyl-CoA thioesterase FadM
MILYANGCSHTAAAEAVVPDCFATDDGFAGIDRRPHPLNLAASWCTRLAEQLNADLVCDAESGSSNDRILRTTRQWIDTNDVSNAFVVIQWTTWEREEWLHNGTWYQVNASGTDWVPQELHLRYKEYVANHDYWAKTQEWYKKIWDLHCELLDRKVTHLFYNGWSTFSDIPNKRDFGKNYLGPYSRDLSYNSVLVNNGFEWVAPNSYHFDAKGHCFWAKYLLQYINEHNLVTHNALSTD